MTAVSPEEFNACFDRFERNVFRLETLAQYLVDAEVERVEAFTRGEPRPERSVRTSAWLSRIATSTAAGKSWQRIHAVDWPLTEYLCYEIAGYVESQACGEEIRLCDLTDELRAHEDFWLFDAGTDNACALAMRYDPDGRYLGADLVNDVDRLAAYTKIRDTVWPTGRNLNEHVTIVPR
ncbi:DUF6879 family protein [Tenggerimyces flavus]|uniref:DUF6879 family protein n=1 Tax=Tenggerimyces flavus TaxID=1708749 RepID=A0ABV7YIS5_9ACTN|nr:DUF6879 family protein [Tenggerimyces flavus]MBM7789952.1 hypothetical protein [Tenggerimyces flavus]